MSELMGVSGRVGGRTERGLPDLRLAGVAVACWLSAWGALYLPWQVGFGLVAAVGAAGAGAWWLARCRPDRRRLLWTVLGVLIGVAAGVGSTAVRVAVRDAEPVAGLARARAQVRVELVIRDDPRPVRGSSGRPSTYAIAADLTRIEAPLSVRLSVRVLVLATDPAWWALLPGQHVIAAGRLQPPRPGDVRSAVLSAAGSPVGVDRPPWVQRAAGGLRSGLQHACAPLASAPGGLLPGLVVGDTSRLEPAVADEFRATGMTHLVAVSGANIAILLGLVLGLLRWCRAGPRLAAAVCVLVLVGFVILVRPSPSVLRAAAMGGLGLLALATGRPGSAVPGLAAAVTILVLVDPELAGDPGFALSVLATAGLLLIAPGWRDALRRRGVPAGLAEALAVPAAAQVACAPVIAAISGTVSLAAVPANLVVVPAIAPATVLGVAAALLSAIWPPGAAFVAWLGSWPAWWLVLVARYGAAVPAGLLPWPGGATGGLLLAALTVATILIGRNRMVRRLLMVVVVAVVIGALPVRLVASGWPPADWLVVVCDVGQGDAVVLPVGPTQAVVVDAGPDPGAVDRCLHRLGVRQVPLLVVSHFHADHVGGIEGVFRGRTVGAILIPECAEPAAGRALVAGSASRNRTPVSVAPTGAMYEMGPLRLIVLGPVRVLSGTRSDPNNNSLVLRVTVRGRTLLLAGDAESEEQHSLIDAVGAAGLRTEVLKVSHHGSAFQDPQFLDATQPAVALVSVGAHNDYGHPNAAVLNRLSQGGTRVLRTDLSGDVAATTTGGRLAVVVRGHDPGLHPP